MVYVHHKLCHTCTRSYYVCPTIILRIPFLVPSSIPGGQSGLRSRALSSASLSAWVSRSAPHVSPSSSGSSPGSSSGSSPSSVLGVSTARPLGRLLPRCWSRRAPAGVYGADINSWGAIQRSGVAGRAARRTVQLVNQNFARGFSLFHTAGTWR